MSTRLFCLVKKSALHRVTTIQGSLYVPKYSVCFYQKQYVTSRSFFSLPDFGNGSTTKELSETKVIGYSMDQFYDVIANVDDYKYFVPWCVASKTFQKSETHAQAILEVGFPPISEKYTSVLTLTRPNLVKSECMDGTLFNHLTCNWKLSKGPKDIANTCTLNFYLSFEFKSLLHSQLSSLFFDEVVRKMVSAFESRCEKVYGPSSLINTKYDPVRSRRNFKPRAVGIRPRAIGVNKKIPGEGS